MQVDDGRDVGWPARVMGGSMQGKDVRLSSEVKNFCISTAFSLNEKMRSVMGAKPKGCYFHMQMEKGERTYGHASGIAILARRRASG